MGYLPREPLGLLYWVFCGLIFKSSLASKEKIAKDLGKRIRKAREDKGISLKDFEAKYNSIAKSNMSAMESGKRLPTLPTLYKIAHLLGISVKDLF